MAKPALSHCVHDSPAVAADLEKNTFKWFVENENKPRPDETKKFHQALSPLRAGTEELPPLE